MGGGLIHKRGRLRGTLRYLFLVGPDKYIEKLKTYMDSADVTFASDSMLRVLRGVVQLFTRCVTSIGSLF